ncbi:uncharacterized protein BP5553_02481 [Venustampulla echinocandica]|uniref:RTA1-domain-containing protein n=1 Tax=Venustampulla echinocandica TaxID=2656787 RepID=A0A370U407_9HELO|nr:uncharacterized protein BP5553_02481 [Venustampulla echinocandica]RDL42502.1 hypothetical protein BP5553_02481 [Venustampulla echinocandica]
MSNSTTPGEVDHNLYGYDPSKTAAYAFVALFVVSGFLHLIFIFTLRAAFFIPLILGSAMEAGGYYCRAWSTANTHNILPFVIQGLLILAAPPLLAATIYMTFGRIVRNLKGEVYSLISPKWLTAIFVLADVICLATQLAGSVLRASDDAATNKRGSGIVLGGLILQVVIFCLFAILASNFHIRFGRIENGHIALPWVKHMVVLYTMSLVFIIRNLVRILEFTQGDDGYLVTHESMLYVFDGAFMLFVVVLLLFVHPGGLFKAARHAMLMTVLGLSNEMAPISASKR